MAKVETKFGEFGFVVECDEKNLPEYFERLLKVVKKEFPNVVGRPQKATAIEKAAIMELKKAPVKKKAPGRPRGLGKTAVKPKAAAKEPRKQRTVAKTPKKPGVKREAFGKHLAGFSKHITQENEILAFANWFGKEFKSKDFFNAVRNANTYSKSKQSNFFNRLSSLKSKNKISNVSKGVYSITDVGKKTLSKLK